MSKVRATLRWVTRRASFTSRRKRSSIPGDVDQLAAEHLERDHLVELGVARAVDAPHAARAEEAEDFVAPTDLGRRCRRGSARRRQIEARLVSLSAIVAAKGECVSSSDIGEPAERVALDARSDLDEVR